MDDNAGVRRLLRRIVQPFAMLVLEASNGAEALESYRRQKPDVVLMDLNMPKMDGFSAMKVIRDMDPFATIIIVTDHDDVDTRLEAQGSGAKAFISKLDLTALQDVLAQYSEA